MSSIRRQVVKAVREAAGETVEGHELAVRRDREHPDLWHVRADPGPVVQIGGAVYIVHAPTSRVFVVPGSLPPELNVTAVLEELDESDR